MSERTEKLTFRVVRGYFSEPGGPGREALVLIPDEPGEAWRFERMHTVTLREHPGAFHVDTETKEDPA